MISAPASQAPAARSADCKAGLALAVVCLMTGRPDAMIGKRSGDAPLRIIPSILTDLADRPNTVAMGQEIRRQVIQNAIVTLGFCNLTHN